MLKWIVGNFINGDITESAELPVIKGSDKINIDINSKDSAVFEVSKNDLGGDWNVILKPQERFVALVDDEVAWASAVIWAGYINKIEASVRGTVMVQAAGLREYMARRIVADVYSGVHTNPNIGKTFTGANYRTLMASIIQSCFSTTGIPSTSPKPPQVLGTVTGAGTGTSVKHTVTVAEFKTYANLIDDMRDEISTNGNEYRFAPTWTSSAKTRIRWNANVASDAQPHTNEHINTNIVLNDNDWKPTSFWQSSTSDYTISRIIGQSNAGEDNKGADITILTNPNSSILVDESYNPGVKLTSTELNLQISQRLDYNSGFYKEAEFERAWTTTAELRTIMNTLGTMAVFSGVSTTESKWFGLTMRIVGIVFSASSKIVKIEVAPKAARYPRLPKERGSKKKEDSIKGGTEQPIIKVPKPGSNGTDIPGYKPPFKLDKDNATDSVSVLELEDLRIFKGYNEYSPDTFYHWHYNIDPTRSRFNYMTGELLGIGNQFVTVEENTPITNPMDIKVFAVDVPGMFNRAPTEQKYMYETYRNSWATTNYPADSHKTLIGTIPYYGPDGYDWIYQMPSEWSNARPPVYGANTNAKLENQSLVSNNFDYAFWTSADFSEVYVQILHTIGRWQIDEADQIAGKKVYYNMYSKVYKGVRDANGLIPEWEDLGTALTQEITPEITFIYFSPNVYEVNGEFLAFGGYRFHRQKDGEKYIDYGEDYALSSYQQGVTKINLSDFSFNLRTINLPVEETLYTDAAIPPGYRNLKYPIAVNVDYQNQKVLYGFSRAQDNQSTFFESKFEDLYNLSKVFSTVREETSPYKMTSVNRIAKDKESFKYSSRAPIAFKSSYFLLNAEGVFESAAGGQLSVGSTSTNAPKGQTVSYIRSKKGYEDTVSGTIPFNNPSNSNDTDSWDDNFPYVHENAMSNGNKLLAFNGFNALAERFPNQYFYKVRPPRSGFEYFVFDGYVYIICDTTITHNAAEDNGLEGRASINSRYWIAKLSIKENLL